jgi:hypothetical protein
MKKIIARIRRHLMIDTIMEVTVIEDTESHPPVLLLRRPARNVLYKGRRRRKSRQEDSLMQDDPVTEAKK